MSAKFYVTPAVTALFIYLYFGSFWQHISGAELDFEAPVRGLDYLTRIVTKRENLRYLRNVLDALDNKLEKFQQGLNSEVRLKRAFQCLSGLPAADCEYNQLAIESLGQEFLRPGGRNPGR